MQEFGKYAESIKDAIKPYAEAAGGYAHESADKLNCFYKKERRRVKRKMRMLHIKHNFDRMVNLTLMAALLISIVCMAAELFKNQEDR